MTPRFKAGETPEGWEQQPAKDAQTDKDARWTKKNDAGSQKLDDVLDLSNTGKEVWADWACPPIRVRPSWPVPR